MNLYPPHTLSFSSATKKPLKIESFDSLVRNTANVFAIRHVSFIEIATTIGAVVVRRVTVLDQPLLDVWHTSELVRLGVVWVAEHDEAMDVLLEVFALEIRVGLKVCHSFVCDLAKGDTCQRFCGHQSLFLQGWIVHEGTYLSPLTVSTDHKLGLWASILPQGDQVGKCLGSTVTAAIVGIVDIGRILVTLILVDSLDGYVLVAELTGKGHGQW